MRNKHASLTGFKQIEPVALIPRRFFACLASLVSTVLVDSTLPYLIRTLLRHWLLDRID